MVIHSLIQKGELEKFGNFFFLNNLKIDMKFITIFYKKINNNKAEHIAF